MVATGAGLLLPLTGMFIVPTFTKLPTLPTRDMGTLVFRGVATAATVVIAGGMWLMMT